MRDLKGRYNILSNSPDIRESNSSKKLYIHSISWRLHFLRPQTFLRAISKPPRPCQKVSRRNLYNLRVSWMVSNGLM